MIILKPGHATESLEEKIIAKARILGEITNKKNFLLPVEDPQDALLWILASFRSPLVVVPFPASLPAAAKERLFSQLPQEECIQLADLPKSGSAALAPKPLNDPWAILFSSGSSGEQKGIILSGSALRASASAHAEHSGIREGSWLLNLPLYHVGGFSVASRAHFLGTSIALGSQKFSAEETLRWIVEGGVSGLSLVPTTLKRLLAFSNFSTPPSLRMILVGGAPLSPDLNEQANRRNLPVFCTYGMTEHCSQVATAAQAGGNLVPLPGVEVKLDGEGEILLRSACLASGTMVRGRHFPLPLEQGFFRTGDLGYQADGHLSIIGRKSDLILSGGLNIFPAEIEEEIGKFPGLADFAVIGLPDSEWGEVACAGLVASSGIVDTAALRSFLRERLDGRKVPKHLIELPAIPRSPLGKVMRPALKAAIEKKILATK